jgi:serine/threonine protein kinase
MTQLPQNTLLQNRYLVGQMIGQGGMGEVYLAIDQRIGGPVVIKRTYFAGDDVIGGGFESEARSLGRVRHPALPKVNDHFVENGEQFIVMDYVAGDDLATRLAASDKPFPLSWVMYWADQLLDALVFLHSNEPPIIHRDVKPQNLKLTESNNIILLDFGLSLKGVAKLESGRPAGFAKPFAPLEQIRGNETYPRSDVYSLAATLYFLLTNVVPPDATQRADAVLTGAPDPLRPINVINPEVTAAISDVVLKGMAVSHDQRYPDARAMQKSLREAFAKMPQGVGEATVVMDTPPEPQVLREDTGAATIPFGMVPNLAETPVAAEVSPPATAEPASDFEATIRYDRPLEPAPPTSEASAKQADIRTEVFIKPDMTFEDSPVQTGTPSTPEVTNEGFVADATTPFVNFESVPAPPPDTTAADINVGGPVSPSPFGSETAAFSETSDFSSPATPFSSGGFDQTTPSMAAGDTENFGPAPAVAAAVAAPVAPALQAPQKKKRSIGLLIGVLAGLFLLLILGAGGAGVAWYVYSGQELPFGLGQTPTPTPTPVPTATPSPSPSATPDESNTSNQNSTDVSSPTPTPETTPESTPGVENTPPRQQTPRPTPVQPTPRQTQVIIPATPRPTIKPTVKPTAKSTLRGREIPQ